MAQAARVNIKAIAHEPGIRASNSSGEFFQKYCQLAGELIQHIGSERFADALPDMFRELLDVSHVSICLLRSDQLPKELILAGSEAKGDQIRIREGLFLDSNAANGSRKIGSSSLVFKLKPPQGSAIRISLHKPPKSQGFLIEELNYLLEITPLLSNLIGQHFGPLHAPSIRSNLRHEIKECMENFGLRILSRREHQIVTMILNGNSNRGISEALNISRETVKLHRKNAYAKLNIKSMGEMFSLFLLSILNPSTEFSGKTAYGEQEELAGKVVHGSMERH
jgi:DNA-binding CsgD family transcriptional regulator